MTPAAFNQSIAASYRLYDDLGLARTFRLPHSLPVNPGFNAVALDTSAPYPDVFMAALRLGHYNFQLRDFSVFQFSMSGPDELRLCFYPSPFGPKEFAQVQVLTDTMDAGGIDFESYCYFIESLDFNARRPLIRYEHSRMQYQPGLHPASHMHIGTYGEDRWVCERRLSPQAFSLMIARLYFSDHWEVLTEDIPPHGRTNELDRQYVAAKTACALSEADLFGPHERGQFYFS